MTSSQKKKRMMKKLYNWRTQNPRKRNKKCKGCSEIKIRESRKKSYCKNKKARLKHNKEYYKNNYENIIKEQRVYKKQNKDNYRRYSEKYRKNNKEKLKKINKNYLQTARGKEVSLKSSRKRR